MKSIMEAPTINAKAVLNFDFSIVMMFRCTQKQYAEQFKKGKLFFNTPHAWIQAENNGDKGRGDILEGTFFTANSNDSSNFIKSLKQNPNLNWVIDKNSIFFRRKDIESVPCLCLYGLKDNSFKKSIDHKGCAHYISQVTEEYFTSFSDSITKEKYSALEDSKKPVVIFINNPHEFFRRVKRSLKKLGLKDNEIIISPVEYIDKYATSLSAIPYPGELLLKDLYYSQQSEIRIIINSTNTSFNKHIKENNNIIDVGSLDDITEIYDFYYCDLLLEKMIDNSIVFNLPTPFFEPFANMELTELLNIYSYIADDRYEIDFNKLGKTKVEVLQILKSIMKSKFDIELSYHKKKFNLYNVNKATWEKIEKNSIDDCQQNNFENDIKNLLKMKNYSDAIRLCQSNKTRKELLPLITFYEGIIYEYTGLLNEAIIKYTECIENKDFLIKALFQRALCYSKQNLHEKAILDYNLLEEIIGYNAQIYSNRGIELIHLCRYNQAVTEFDNSIALEENSFAYYNRSVSYFRSKNFKKAKDDILKALELSPCNEYYIKEYEKYYKNL